MPEALLDDVADRVATRVAVLLGDRLGAPPAYLDVDGAAQYLACSRQRVYDLVHEGRVRVHRDGRRLLFRSVDLDAALTVDVATPLPPPPDTPAPAVRAGRAEVRETEGHRAAE